MSQFKTLLFDDMTAGTIGHTAYEVFKEKKLSVDYYDFTNDLPGIKKRTFFGKVKRNLFLSYYKRKISKNFLLKVESLNPDIILIVKGLFLSQDTVEDLKRRGKYLVYWSPDDIFNMNNSNDDVLKAFPKYDLIVSPRKHLFDKYREFGAKEFLYIDWYYVPDLHKNFNLPVKYDITFVGSWSSYRENFIQGINRKVKIWGSGWEKTSDAFKHKHELMNKILSKIEMSKVFNESRYNLNLLTVENSDQSNLRYYEATASNGLLLTPRNDFAKEYLKDRLECLMFDDVSEVNQILEDKTLDLDSICKNGYKAITEGGNTFKDRVESLIEYLEKKFK